MAYDIMAEREVVDVELGGQTIRVYTRRPSPHEIVEYQKDIQGCFKKKNGVPDAAKLLRVQARYGLKVMTGIRPGDLLANGKPLTEERDGWKKLIQKHEPRIPAAVGRAVFEAASAERDGDQDEEDGAPLE